MATQSNADETRRPLSRARVLQAAIDLADERGIESLTMRRLGQELGVEAMSLYNHVANKDDILSGIVDLVIGGLEPSPAADDWKAAIRTLAVSAHEALLRHPWACSLMLSASRLGPGRLRYMNTLLEALRGAGFSPASTYHAYHALDSHILGFTLWELGHSIDAKAQADFDVPAFLREIAAEYPYLAEHVEQHVTESGPGDEGEFELGLDLILDGLERIRRSS
jgi:AcrR family transcriptional regulator